jgi:hypothetical protein
LNALLETTMLTQSLKESSFVILYQSEMASLNGKMHHLFHVKIQLLLHHTLELLTARVLPVFGNTEEHTPTLINKDLELLDLKFQKISLMKTSNA